jgi:hypothetical protein
MRHRPRRPFWTHAQIVQDCDLSASRFRDRRVRQPLDDYLAEYVAAKAAVDSVVGQLDRIFAEPTDQQLLAAIAGNKALFTALRYLAAPPISEGDLSTLLSSPMSATALRNDSALAKRLVQLLRTTIDPKRFPWVHEGTEPTPEQLDTATVASAVAATIQRVQTKRRGDETSGSEQAVEDLLIALGFRKRPAPRHSIEAVEDLPAAGEYMTRATLRGHNGDFVIGLFDEGRHRLALECKSSNSSLNSRKRLNKEVVADAKVWAGLGQVIPGAVLRGVFDPRYAQEAQDTPMVIFWSHRLDDLRDFIEATRRS